MRDMMINNRPMLNAYPDSMGGKLSDIVKLLEKKELEDTFSSFYILPSIFNTDLDRGFSVISYDLNESLASTEDLKRLKNLGIDLKLDFVLNHASVLSEQFQDLIANGERSKYKDFFINWNTFWQGYGTMTKEGYIQPKEELIRHMFFRKKGLPILMVRFPDGKNVPYWNTFYQAIRYPILDAQDVMKMAKIQFYGAEKIAELVNRGIKEGKKIQEIDFQEYEEYRNIVVDHMENKKKYLGQMDLNIKSPLVWEFYNNVLHQLAEYGANIVRLDAFAYALKEPGEKNFLNEPKIWGVLEKVRQIAEKYNLFLLPEIHTSYQEKKYENISLRGYMTYDFFLPGLVIAALENKDGNYLKQWADEIIEKKMKVVNMLGCHDGIPVLDLKGMLPEKEVQKIIDIIVSRGGIIKNLHGQKKVYYQVNATYYSALGEDDKKLLLARAIQLFMPGKPQIWYLDLFAGKNDFEAVHRAGEDGHKEINRTNLTRKEIEEALTKEVVKKQLDMLRFRNTFQAFDFDSNIVVESKQEHMKFIWEKKGYKAQLICDLENKKFTIKGIEPDGNIVVYLEG